MQSLSRSQQESRHSGRKSVEIDTGSQDDDEKKNKRNSRDEGSMNIKAEALKRFSSKKSVKSIKQAEKEENILSGEEEDVRIKSISRMSSTKTRLIIDGEEIDRTENSDERSTIKTGLSSRNDFQKIRERTKSASTLEDKPPPSPELPIAKYLMQGYRLSITAKFFNSPAFELREGWFNVPRDTRILTLRFIHKRNFEESRLRDYVGIYYLQNEKYDKEPSKYGAACYGLIENHAELLVIQHSHIGLSLHEMWMKVRHENQSCVQKTEKFLSKWFVEIIRCMQRCIRDNIIFEFISVKDTFFLDYENRVVVGDFYCATYTRPKGKMWIRQRNEHYLTKEETLSPPEAKRLAMDASAFSDLESFMPGSIWMAGALLYNYTTGSNPTYISTNDKRVLKMPKVLEKYSPKFRSFLQYTLEYETECRPLGFQMAVEHAWIGANYGYKVVPTAQQLRDDYFETMWMYQGVKKKNKTDHSVFPAHIKTRNLMCRSVPFTFRKDLYLHECDTFNYLASRIKKTKFEQRLEQQKFKGLVYYHPHMNDEEMPKRFGAWYDASIDTNEQDEGLRASLTSGGNSSKKSSTTIQTERLSIQQYVNPAISQGT